MCLMMEVQGKIPNLNPKFPKSKTFWVLTWYTSMCQFKKFQLWISDFWIRNAQPVKSMWIIPNLKISQIWNAASPSTWIRHTPAVHSTTQQHSLPESDQVSGSITTNLQRVHMGDRSTQQKSLWDCTKPCRKNDPICLIWQKERNLYDKTNFKDKPRNCKVQGTFDLI